MTPKTVLNGNEVILAMEVRSKTISQPEFSSFARSCAAAELHRAVMCVDAYQQDPLDVRGVAREAGLEEVQVEVFECAADLLLATLLWANSKQEKTIEIFSRRMLDRLREIEATVPTLEEWTRAVSIAQSR